MSNLYRILSFVPPFLFFVLPAFSQLQGSLEQIPGNDAYQVSVIPSVNWSPPNSITSSAQITLRATTGTLQIVDFQPFVGNWVAAPPIVAPAEAPGFDYFSFSLQAPVANLVLTAGSPIALFSFKNQMGCTNIQIVNNTSDPFLPPNSMSVNIGNFFSMVGSGIGANGYEGNAQSDAVGCPQLGVEVSAANNPVPCFGNKTNLTVKAIGGVEPYDINWTNAAGTNFGTEVITVFEGTLVLPQMPADQYFITLKDALDSVRHDTLQVLQPAELNIEVEAFDASCNGSEDGVVFVDKVNGGTAGYQYFWDTDPTTSNQTVNNVNPGSYTVTVVDANGCQASSTVDVGTFFVIFPNPIIKHVSCNGANNGVIDLYPVSLNGPYSYNWSENVTTPNNLSSAYQLAPGTYSVTIYDATGVCYEVATYEITEPAPLEIDYALTEPICHGEKGLLEILSVENAVEGWTAAVIGGKNLGDGIHFELEPGLPLRLEVQDSNGCEAVEEFIVSAKQALQLELGEGKNIKYGEEVQLDPDVFPFSGVTFEWSPSDGLSCTDCPDPVAKPTETTTYRLRMTDGAGCSLEDQIVFSVRKSRDIYIPNAFSPNKDGINDSFCPYGGFEVVSIRHMQIFDRWGGKVYDSAEAFSPNETDACWDGTARGKEAVPGVYLYTMNIEYIDGPVVLYSGELNLVR